MNAMPLLPKSSKNRHIFPMLGAAGVLACTSLLGGCSLLDIDLGLDSQSPTFAVTGVSLAEVSAEAASIVFEVEGANPNADELHVRDINYTVTMTDVQGGSAVFEGERFAQATLPPASSEPLFLPAAITTDDAGSLFGELNYEIVGTITYELPGAFAELLFDNNVRRPRATFRDSGVIEVR